MNQIVQIFEGLHLRTHLRKRRGGPAGEAEDPVFLQDLLRLGGREIIPFFETDVKIPAFQNISALHRFFQVVLLNGVDEFLNGLESGGDLVVVLLFLWRGGGVLDHFN